MPNTFSEDDYVRGFTTTNAVGSNASLDFEVDNALPESDILFLDPTPEALRYEHPDYRANMEKWIKYLDLYESNDIYRYIFQHVREHDETWKQRVERGYYYNYVATVVDLFTAFLYKAPISRTFASGLSERMEKFLKDVDFRGTSFNTFMNKVCTYAKLQGHNAILVDAPSEDEAAGIVTLQDEKDADIRPYLVHIYAHQILDWKLDKFGNFEWVKLRVYRPEERSWMQGADVTTEHYQIWNREMWAEYVVEKTPGGKDEAYLADFGDHDTGVVPLVIVRTDKCTHPWFGSSVVRDIADINIAILNWSSMQDEEIYNRALNVLICQSSGEDSPINLSHYNVFAYPEGADPPSYLVPGPTPLEQIRASIGDARDEIRRLAKMNISTGFSDVRQASSGIAHAFQFIEANQNLANKAMALETAETAVLKLVARYMGTDSVEVSVEYAKEFGIDDFTILLTEIEKIGETILSDTALKEAQKDFIRRRFTTKSAKDIQTMVDEIEEAEIPEFNPLPGMESGASAIGAFDDEGSDSADKASEEEAASKKKGTSSDASEDSSKATGA